MVKFFIKSETRGYKIVHTNFIYISKSVNLL